MLDYMHHLIHSKSRTRFNKSRKSACVMLRLTFKGYKNIYLCYVKYPKCQTQIIIIMIVLKLS